MVSPHYINSAVSYTLAYLTGKTAKNTRRAYARKQLEGWGAKHISLYWGNSSTLTHTLKYSVTNLEI